MATLNLKHLQKIKQLYYANFMGVSDIAKHLGVSIDAVYYFMRRYNLSRRTLSEYNSLRFAHKPASFQVKKKMSGQQNDLRIIGTMLYWGEGFQSSHATYIDFANSKPEMIKLFVLFLREICGINENKLRGFLYCYSNQDVPTLINFWSKVAKIPKSQITKPYVRNDFDVKKSGKMPHGLFHVRYYDKKLLILIQSWIKEYVDKYTA